MLPFIAPIIATLSSFTGTVAQALVKLAPTIASALSKVAPMLESIAKPILEIAPKIGELISVVVNTINEVAKVLGLVKGEMSPDELGERALQHPEINPGNCSSAKEYVDKLQEADFDVEKFKNLTPGERAMAVAVGAGLEIKALCERFKMDVPVQYFEMAAKGNMTASDVTKLLSALSANGVRDAGLIVNYVAGCLRPEHSQRVRDAVSQYESEGGRPMSEIESDIANKVVASAPVADMELGADGK